MAEPVMRFEGEEEGEKVLFVLRAHPITNLPWILLVILLLLIPTLFSLGLGVLGIDSIPIRQQTIFLITLTWYLIVLSIAFQEFLYWYFNIYILTNRKIVDIDYFNLFYRKISQTTLSNVQDITFTKGGLFQNFFDYGDIHIQTAGTSANFEFTHIPDPEGNQKRILELVHSGRGGV
jgi:hypothetical protein